jgi:membrane-associated protease RseP (regulator of RpoE activity)
VKGFLSQRGIPFTEIDVSRDAAAAQDLARRTGRLAVPVTDIDGNLVVGFDQQQLEHYLALARTAAAPPFGASVADARKITASRGLPAVSGAYIGAVKPGLPAAASGLKPGDIITRIDTATISSAADLDQALSGLEKGARIRITFVRDGSPRQAEGTL